MLDLNDVISVQILKYILEHNNVATFAELARNLSADIGSRRALFGKLVFLENSSVLLSDMRHVTKYDETHIQRWVKEYRIAEKYLPEIEEMLSIEEK